jgi:hypothetical protein
MHLKPTAGCEVSTLKFGYGGHYTYPMKNISRTENIFFMGYVYGPSQIQISKLIFDTLLWA